MSNNDQTDIPLDILFYSCFEYEHYLNSLPPDSARRISWPAIKNESEKLSQLSLDLALKQLFAWYMEKFDVLRVEKQIDSSVIGLIGPAIVFLTKDLGLLYKLKESENIEESDVANLESYLKKVSKIMAEIFPINCSLYEQYLQWAFSKKTEEKIVFGSRPPVGRYAPKLSYEEKPPFANSHTPSFKDRESRPERPREEREKFPRNRDRDRGDGRDRDRFRGKDRNRNNRSNRDGDRENFSKEMEQVALNDASRAFEKLKSNSEIKKVILDPQNSFYRRLQHTAAIENGFESESVGEGKNRSVVVIKK